MPLAAGVRVTCHKTLRWRGAGGFFKWMLRIRDTSDSTGAFRGAAPDRTGGRTGTKDPLGTADTEIAPNFRHPILKKTVTQMLEAVKEEA